VSLAHQTKLSKSQRAVIAANIFDGIFAFQPTQVELAKLLGISVPMVDKARRLSPAAREQIAKGKATLATFKTPPAMPKSTTIKSVVIDINKSFAVSDDILRKIIAARGVDHVVDVAAAMEAAE
jgi:hypothetical protein